MGDSGDILTSHSEFGGHENFKEKKYNLGEVKIPKN